MCKKWQGELVKRNLSFNLHASSKTPCSRVEKQNQWWATFTKIECLVAQSAKSITCTSRPGQNSRLKHNQGEKRFAFRELGLQHNPSRATPTRESTAHAEHEPRVHTLYLFSWIVEGLNVSLKLKHVSICTRDQSKPQKQPPVAWKVLNTRMHIQTIIDEM